MTVKLASPRVFLLHNRTQKQRALEALFEQPVSQENPLVVQMGYPEAGVNGEQRGWLHVLCEILSEATGYTPGEIKELAKRELWGTTVVEIAGRHIEVVRSSEEASRKEYAKLIDTVYRIGADAGVPLPDPDPNYWRKRAGQREEAAHA